MNEIELSLQGHADQINERYEMLLKAQEEVDNQIFEIGRLLNEVKAKLPHGQFISWVNANCNFTRQHATKLMRIEQRREDFVVPPTSINEAVRELRRIDQMEPSGSISTTVPTLPRHVIFEVTRGKFYRKLYDLRRYIELVREEGYHQHMENDEADCIAEIALRLVQDLRLVTEELSPAKSYIKEVKS